MLLRKYGLPFFAPDNGGNPTGGSQGENAENKGEGNKDTPEDKSQNPDNKPPEKTHTQADVDKIVNDRLAREKKKYEKMIDDMKKQLNPAEGDGQQQQQAQPDPATQQVAQQAQAALAAANQKLIQATAVAEAVKLGVDPKYTADVVRLADLSKIEVKEDGNMDTGAIDKAIDEVLKRVPVFKVTADTTGGFKIGGQSQQQTPNSNGWTNNQSSNQNAKPWNRTNRQ